MHAVVLFTANAIDGSGALDVTVVGTHSVARSGTADMHLVRAPGTQTFMLTDEGYAEYEQKLPDIAKYGYVRIDG